MSEMFFDLSHHILRWCGWSLGISTVLDGGYTGDWKLGDRLPLKLNPPPSRGGQGIY